MGKLIKTQIYPCGRCGKNAIADPGVAAHRDSNPPVTYRCPDPRCLSGPQGTLAEAVTGWNRVSQGWIGLDVLVEMAKSIPGIEPQINQAMKKRFLALVPKKTPGSNSA